MSIAKDAEDRKEKIQTEVMKTDNLMESVLYLGPDYANHRGGIGAVLEVYAKNLRPFKFIPTFETKSGARKTVVYIKSIFKLIWVLLTDRKIKILHFHTASKGSFMRKSILLLIGKMFGKKLVLHIHGGGFQKFYSRSKIKPYIRFIISKADLIICLSEMWREYYSATFKIKKLAIVNNVIEAAPESLPVIARNGHVNLLFLGLIADKKGLFDLLDVLKDGRNSLNDTITVTIAGNGETERLEKQIHQNHSGGSVKYAGWVNGDQKSQLLNACDAYILPSYFEGLPISILEAMAYGKPIISTDVGGIPEIVKPGYNGWLFKPGDQGALEGILNEVVSNKSLLTQYGRNSLELSKKYTPDAVFESLTILYNQLLHV